jgi:hypothetical protein
LKEAQLERDILDSMLTTSAGQKNGQHFFQGRQQIFRFMKEHREVFAVEKMEVLKVSVCGYYYWLNIRLVAEQSKNTRCWLTFTE